MVITIGWQLALVGFLLFCAAQSAIGEYVIGECSNTFPLVEGGRVDQKQFPAPYPVGNEIEYVCDAGFGLAGTTQRIHCLPSLAWEKPSFTCQAVACGDPGNVPNSIRGGQLWTFRHKVEYICNEGYVMVSGSNIRYCQANRRWSGTTPTCSPINCTQPENPEHGIAIYRNLRYGSIVTYECTGQKAIEGEERRVCQSNGQWSGFVPRCVEVDCGVPYPHYLGGRVRQLGGTRLNDIIEYKCSNGYTERAICQYPSKQWQPPPPDCMNNELTTTTSVQEPPLTVKPQKRGFFCRWKIFQGWLC